MNMTSAIGICFALGLDPSKVESINIVAKRDKVEVDVHFVFFSEKDTEGIVKEIRKYVLLEKIKDV